MDTNRIELEGRKSRVVGIDHETSRTIGHEVIDVLRALTYAIEVVPDPLEWLIRSPEGTMLVAVSRWTPQDLQGACLAAPRAIIVAVCDRMPNAATFRRYLAAGANNVIATDLPCDQLSRALAATLSGLVALPRPVAEAIVARLEDPPQSLHLTARDARVLRLLASGASLATTAAEVGCSPRHLRRITADLMSTMGAVSRTHAAALATRWGLTEPGTSSTDKQQA